MKKRDTIYQKYNGLCAYSGKPLQNDWQVDHMTSKIKHQYNSRINCSNIEQLKERMKGVNHIDNLMPVLKIVNHYKRGFDLEAFRTSMLSFHLRLRKLPKKTNKESTRKRIEYMNTIADIFDINIDKPFSGIFYFETI